MLKSNWKMKTFSKYILQKLLGFQTYLYVFALYVIIKIRWDKNEKDFFHFMNLIKGDGLIIDLGANIGVTSYHLAKKFPQSNILSFEPLTPNMFTLKRVKERFKLDNIKEKQLAVGDRDGTLEMVMPVVSKVPMHGLSHVVNEENTENNQGIKYNIPVVKLDSVDEIQQNKNAVTAIKMDIENFEYYALKGAESIIKQNKPIIYCELWDNENRKKCISFLNKLEYSAFVLNKKELVPFEISPVEKHNFFFLPN